MLEPYLNNLMFWGNDKNEIIIIAYQVNSII